RVGRGIDGQAQGRQGSRGNRLRAKNTCRVRTVNHRGADRTHQPVVGDPRSVGHVRVAVGIAQGSQRPGGGIEIQVTRGKRVRNRRTARERVDVVLVPEPFKTPLDGVLARDVLQVRIYLVAVTILVGVKTKSGTAHKVALQRTAAAVNK